MIFFSHFYFKVYKDKILKTALQDQVWNIIWPRNRNRKYYQDIFAMSMRKQVLAIQGCLMHLRENVSLKQSLFSNDNKSAALSRS